MAGLSNAAQAAIWDLIFQGTTWASVAQNASSPYTNYYVQAHTADPTNAGSQNFVRSQQANERVN
jgi:hypothetical protein